VARADTGSDWLKQLKRFTAVLAFLFQLKQNSFETVLSFISIVWTA